MQDPGVGEAAVAVVEEEVVAEITAGTEAVVDSGSVVAVDLEEGDKTDSTCIKTIKLFPLKCTLIVRKRYY